MHVWRNMCICICNSLKITGRWGSFLRWDNGNRLHSKLTFEMRSQAECWLGSISSRKPAVYMNASWTFWEAPLSPLKTGNIIEFSFCGRIGLIREDLAIKGCFDPSDFTAPLCGVLTVSYTPVLWFCSKTAQNKKQLWDIYLIWWGNTIQLAQI